MLMELKMNKNIIIYVQNLLGIGHLKRISLICKELTKQDLEVTVISGGKKISEIDFGPVKFIQLPIIKALNADFSILVDDQGKLIDDNLKIKRKKIIIDTLNDIKPKILITEMFPFGRKKMDFELIPLLKLAKEKKLTIISSIRDIINIKDKNKLNYINSNLSKYYNYVLVHGEKKYFSIEKKVKLNSNNKIKIIYTGYICDSLYKNTYDNKKNNEIIVSAGGGAVGEKIFLSSIKLALNWHNNNFLWRILLGKNWNSQNKNKYLELIEKSGKNILIEDYRNDFSEIIQNCSLSISQCGYNTFVETVSYRVKSIFIPFSGDKNGDQVIRSQIFEHMDTIKVIDENKISPSILKKNATDLLDKRDIYYDIPKMQGTELTANFIKSLIHE